MTDNQSNTTAQSNIPERQVLENGAAASPNPMVPSSNDIPVMGNAPIHMSNAMLDPSMHATGISYAYGVPAPPPQRSYPNHTFAPHVKQAQSFRANNPNYNGTNTSYGLPSYGHTNYGKDCSQVNTTEKEEIDSALIAALRDPKERAALLRLEMELLKFMDSANGWMEIAGSYNSIIWMGDPSPPMAAQQQNRQSSFQRCVLHRLSDRFGIVREQGQLPGALRLIKEAHSAIPAVKLNDLNGEDLNEAFSRLRMEATPPPPVDAPSKMKIMKRKSTPADAKPVATKEQPKANPTGATLVEKEKAYAETRARIFAPDGLDKGQSANVGAPKAVYRNREQEVCDPDFRRGSFNASPQQQQQQPAPSRLQAAAPAFVPKGMAEDSNTSNEQTTG